jgi:hypothetical protein
MLTAETAALFLFVDWSEYARCGREIFEEAEVELTATSSNRSVSWWIVDVSTADAPPNPALHGWLRTQEQTGNVRVFPNIAMGNGSVVWTKGGKVVRFEPSALRSGPAGLVHRTLEILAES